jgi:hypothetical protein
MTPEVARQWKTTLYPLKRTKASVRQWCNAQTEAAEGLLAAGQKDRANDYYAARAHDLSIIRRANPKLFLAAAESGGIDGSQPSAAPRASEKAEGTGEGTQRLTTEDEMSDVPQRILAISEPPLRQRCVDAWRAANRLSAAIDSWRIWLIKPQKGHAEWGWAFHLDTTVCDSVAVLLRLGVDLPAFAGQELEQILQRFPKPYRGPIDPEREQANIREIAEEVKDIMPLRDELDRLMRLLVEAPSAAFHPVEQDVQAKLRGADAAKEASRGVRADTERSARRRRRQSSVSKCRLQLIGRTVAVNGKPVPLNMTPERAADALAFLGELLKEPGNWMSSTDIGKATQKEGIRFDRIFKALPGKIKSLLESNRRKGYRVRK